MKISELSQSYRPDSLQSMKGSNDVDSKISALEQKLQKLDNDKQKAVENKDENTKKKLEKQIQEIKKQIEQLKKQKNNKEEAVPSEPAVNRAKAEDPDRGNYVDEYL